MSSKILHISSCDKFIPPFIQFVKENFDFRNHQFLLHNGMAEKDLITAQNIYFSKRSVLGRIKHYLQAVIKMHQVDKVMLHGLFDVRLVFILFLTPWLLKKCYWIMFGGDLYAYQLGERNLKWKMREFFRRSVISRIGHLVTYVEGDVELARNWYSAKGQYHECIMYLSNVYKELDVPTKISSKINIQIGNSANPTNNHIEALKKLFPYKDEDICIYLPLSYGSQEYADEIIEKGRKWFGNKITPLTDFMPFDNYLNFLGKIDIAMFNHERQQAMGNTITLLGLGKTVYIRSGTSQWKFFKDKGIIVGDISNFESLNVINRVENVNKIKDYFSMENLKKQCAIIFS